MASDKRKGLEDLERDITCAICQEHYTEPKLLPCLHYYCKKCILKLATRTASNQPFSCPECRKKTTLPEDGVEGLKTAFFVYRMQSMYSTVERVHGKVEVKCEGCTDSQDKAEAFCRQCAMFICKDCVKQHKKLKVFTSHEVDSLEDLKQGRAREITVEEPPTKKCSIHEEPLIIYCFDCASLICLHCTARIHRDHNFEFSKVAAPNTRMTLLEKMEPIKERVAKLSQAVGDILTTIQELEDQGASVANTIESSFSELQQILTKRKKELLLEASNTVYKKKSTLLAQQQSLCLSHAELQSIVDHTERLVGHCSDNEVMSMLTEINDRIQRDAEEHCKVDQNLGAVEEADMWIEVRCRDALMQLCENNIYFTQAVDPSLCTVRDEGAEKAEVDQRAEVTLTTRLSNNEITRRPVIVVSQLKSVYDGSLIICDVKQLSTSEYCIQYTPTVRGRHELTVLVNGQPVLGSPFSVFVSISPTKLGQPVQVYRDIGVPRGITINSENDIIVSVAKSIFKLDRNGRNSLLVESSTTQMTSFQMLSSDNDNNIYCTDSDSDTILRCNKLGSNIQSYVGEKNNNIGHWGIAAVLDKVLVCKHKLKGTIMVYNKDLQYVKLIQHDNMGEFYGISADTHGNLYVTDPSYSCIRVFNNDGVLLRSINCKTDMAKTLTRICGICVSGHYLYVTDWTCHCVAVFTIEGEYITSYGRYGNNEGEFNYPRDVCVDRDGFVYVADDSNRRVQCF